MTASRTSRKAFASAAIAAIASFASYDALAACDHLEFAEMDAMTKEELLDLRCQYTQSELNAGSRSTPNPDELHRCIAEIPRMDRILARKYKLVGPPTLTSSGPLPPENQIILMCGGKLKIP